MKYQAIRIEIRKAQCMHFEKGKVLGRSEPKSESF